MTLARLILGADATPGWVCVGHPEPERQVRILLDSPRGKAVDVSANHAMVALVPFQVAIRLEGLDVGPRPRLSVQEKDGGEIGQVRLRRTREVEAGPYRIGLFETDGCTNRCLPAPRLHAHYLLQRWKLARDRNPNNVRMTPADLFAKFVLFAAPRPVVLVSHQKDGRGGQGNLFPMDLVGEAGSPCYLLGLHRTSPAIPSMIEAGRLAISTVPLGWKKTVFGLGRNHRQATIDWKSLPFGMSFKGIPVPTAALTIREVRIEKTVDVGSHILFITTTETLDRRSAGLQMCHTHGFYQMYLQKHGRSLPVESPV